MVTSSATTTAGKHLHLHSARRLRRTKFNRAFAAAYSLALLTLLYRHTLILLHSISAASISLLLADTILAFMWSTAQSFRMNPIVRQVHLENLENIVSDEGFQFPAMDIFVCTADPYKEPPLKVVNTALSVMAYDYPPEKLSVYVSDDGGSELTLFAFMEAAEFARFWLPFCRENNVMDRCPDAFFKSVEADDYQSRKIKDIYERMKTRIEKVMEKGKVTHEFITNDHILQAFAEWKLPSFSRQQHPSIIQVLSESCKDKDIAGCPVPNSVYVSREKSKTSPHHFKAGALNALLRVSAIMTNAPIVLTLDCDMYSNDPKTPHQVLCFLMDPPGQPDLGYIHYPQIFHGLNRPDIYGSEFKPLFQMNPVGLDGLRGPNYFGTGCFFVRRIFFGGPGSFVEPEIPELRPDCIVKEDIKSQNVMNLAHRVAACNYEDNSKWGSKIGFKYGSLVEDYYTGYRFQCEGWHAKFYNPKRAAFLGDIPITLNDALSQAKRWAVGLLEVAFSGYSPATYGVKAMGFLPAHCFSHYAFWPLWSISVTIYALVPSLTLLNNISIFPKVSDPWFCLYAFLFLGAYGQGCLDFILAGSSFERWWNDQRMWLIRGLTCNLFGFTEYLTKHLGIATPGFNVTSKVVDDEQKIRYNKGMFEFGIPSPMFVPLSVAAIINLMALSYGVVKLGLGFDALFVQTFVAGFGVVNCLPIYEAMVLRGDKGRMPTKITMLSGFFAFGLYSLSLAIVKIK